MATTSPTGSDGHLSASVSVAGLRVRLVMFVDPEVMDTLRVLVSLAKVSIIRLLYVILPLSFSPTTRWGG